MHKIVDIDRPSTWTKWHKSLCFQCKASCCSMPVEVYVEDLCRLNLASFEECQDSLKKVAQRLKKAKIIKSFNLRKEVFILEQNYGTCLFLDRNHRCKVYEQRPKTCREHPVTGPRPGYCPASSRKSHKGPHVI